MKSFLRFSISAAASFFAVACFASGASAFKPTPVKVIGEADNLVELYAPATKDMSKPLTKAPGQTHSLTVEVNSNGVEAYPVKICAATEINGELFWENAEQISSMSFQFDLPDGVYDVLGVFYTDNLDACTMYYESVEISGENSQMIMNLADANVRTDILIKDTQGNTLEYDLREENDKVARYGLLTFADYKGSTLVLYDYFSQQFKYCLTNDTESPYNLTFASRAVCKEDMGVLYAILPIDFNKADNCASSSNWQSVAVTFEPTPFNNKYSTEGNYFYGSCMSWASFIAEGLWYFSAGQGATHCDTGKISIWTPEDYNGFVDVVVYPMGCVFGSNDAAIKGMALKRTENGLTQLGQDMYFGRALCTTPYDQDILTGGNPLYQFNPDGLKLGNCAPTLINYQATWTMFDYQFTGRYGEELSIDSFDLSDRTSNLEEFGGDCTSSVLITCNGRTICDSRFDFNPENDGPEGNYHVEISTDNVLVDGEVPGYNKTVFEYDTDNMGQSPTIAGLQFRNTEDKITDHFEVAADGRLILYATQFMADYDEELDEMFYNAINLSNIKVEAAPYNTEDYFEIPVETDPSKNIIRGWGQYYEGSLQGVTARSDNGWYKLRVRLEGVNEGWQEQIICPAFKIEALSNGVENIEAERSPLNFYINGRNIIAPGARIYNLNGTETDGKNLVPGIYLITTGSKTAKAIVK